MRSPEEQLVAVFRRFGGAVARGLLSGAEFTNRVLDEFASLDRVFPAIIPTLWDLVPTMIRGEFDAALRRATTPEFRYRAFVIGGGEPSTEDELRRDADLRTARVRAWAIEFVHFLDVIG